MKRRIPPTWLVGLVLSIYLGLFGLSVWNPSNSLKNDSAGYLTLADSLRTYHVFSETPLSPGSPELFRLPGYPFFLALTGARISSYLLVIGLQCLMGAGLLFLLWPEAERLGGVMGASAAALFLCLDPVSVMHHNLILTEALMMFSLTAAVVFALAYLEHPTTKNALFSGILFGLSALIKPIGIIPAVIFFICSFRNWKNVCLLGLILFAMPLAWTVRNWRLTGRPVYTVQGGYALFLYPAANALAMDTGLSRQEAIQLMEKSLAAEGLDRPTDPIAQSLAYEKIARRIMQQHRLATLKINLKGAVAILGGTGLEMILDLLHMPQPPEPSAQEKASLWAAGTRAIFRRYPLLLLFQIAYIVFLLTGYLIFLKGLMTLLRSDRGRLAAFLGLSALALLAVASHQGYYRFRLPLLPFMALGGAASWAPSRERNDLHA